MRAPQRERRHSRSALRLGLWRAQWAALGLAAVVVMLWAGSSPASKPADKPEPIFTAVRSRLKFTGRSVTSMWINGRKLDPQRSYTSAWIGDRTGGSEASISGNGTPIVGVFGSEDQQHIKALGLYYVSEPAPVAEPPA